MHDTQMDYPHYSTEGSYLVIRICDQIVQFLATDVHGSQRNIIYGYRIIMRD